MFQKFHDRLRTFKANGCQRGSCQKMQRLTLKFIVHYGSIGSVMIKGYYKLFGKAIITAHRLMKNGIAFAEYMLITNNVFFNKEKIDKENMIDKVWKKGSMMIIDIGEIHFLYRSLSAGVSHNI